MVHESGRGARDRVDGLGQCAAGEKHDLRAVAAEVHDDQRQEGVQREAGERVLGAHAEHLAELRQALRQATNSAGMHPKLIL